MADAYVRSQARDDGHAATTCAASWAPIAGSRALAAWRAARRAPRCAAAARCAVSDRAALHRRALRARRAGRDLDRALAPLPLRGALGGRQARARRGLRRGLRLGAARARRRARDRRRPLAPRRSRMRAPPTPRSRNVAFDRAPCTRLPLAGREHRRRRVLRDHRAHRRAGGLPRRDRARARARTACSCCPAPTSSSTATSATSPTSST